MKPKSIDAEYFLAQDIGPFSLRSTLSFPNLQTKISLGVMLNRLSCLYYTAQALGQEATALSMH